MSRVFGVPGRPIGPLVWTILGRLFGGCVLAFLVFSLPRTVSLAAGAGNPAEQAYDSLAFAAVYLVAFGTAVAIFLAIRDYRAGR